MYKYFMGKRSNLETRTHDTPIVIAVDELSSDIINEWLDKYLLDFDVFVERLKIIFKTELVKINFVDKDSFICYLKDDNVFFVCLMHEREPKCTLHLNNNKFILNFKEEVPVEEYYEENEKYRCGMTYSSYMYEIFVGNPKVLISIKFSEKQDDLYEKIKENIESLENWNNIKSVIYWLYSFYFKVFSFTLTITTLTEEMLEMEKIEVSEDKIMKYVVVDDEDEYAIELDGSWYAKCNEIMVKYDALARRKYLIILPNYTQSSLLVKSFLNTINEYIEVLAKSIKELNDFMERISY